LPYSASVENNENLLPGSENNNFIQKTSIVMENILKRKIEDRSKI
jgi:hypothetical protein